jgi:ankyrin repeat protein
MNQRGSTPLHYAAQEGRGDIVVMLLESGADIGARNRKVCIVRSQIPQINLE